jgi:hypothetical protein
VVDFLAHFQLGNDPLKVAARTQQHLNQVLLHVLVIAIQVILDPFRSSASFDQNLAILVVDVDAVGAQEIEPFSDAFNRQHEFILL